MAAIQQVLNEFVRNELEDETQSRWSDARLLAFYKQAVMRMMSVGQKNRIQFMRNKLEFTLPAEATTRTLPDDYLSPLEPDGLIRRDQAFSLLYKENTEFDRILTASELSCYTIEDGNIIMRDASLSDTEFVFRYFIDVKPHELLISSQTPWNGQLDLPMCDYVRLRAMNVDRFNTSPDQALLTDMEEKVVSMYAYQNPSKYRSKGWVPNYGLFRRT